MQQKTAQAKQKTKRNKKEKGAKDKDGKYVDNKIDNNEIEEMLKKAIYGESNLAGGTLVENCISSARAAQYLESGKKSINQGDNDLNIRNIVGTYTTKANILKARIIDMDSQEVILNKVLTEEEAKLLDSRISIYNFIGTDIKQLGIRITEIKETKKLIAIINKDKKDLTKEEQAFLKENFFILLNTAKEEALKDKDYDLLIKLTSEEMRTMLKSQKENIEAHANSNMYDAPEKRAVMDAKIRQNNEAGRTGEEPISVSIWRADAQWVISENIRTNKNDTYCNSLLGCYLSELDIYVPWKNSSGKWMTANMMTQYFDKSDDWYEIPRLNGTLDHISANWWALQGAAVVAAYDSGNDKHGHVSIVVPVEMTAKFKETRLKDYTFTTKREDTAFFSSNYSTQTAIGVKYYVYLPKAK